MHSDFVHELSIHFQLPHTLISYTQSIFIALKKLKSSTSDSTERSERDKKTTQTRVRNSLVKLGWSCDRNVKSNTHTLIDNCVTF